MPHLAKLLANNNSVKVWIILDSKKKSFRYWNSFSKNHGRWFQDHFEDEVLIFERTLWSTTPWCFVGKKSNCFQKTSCFQRQKKPNQCGVTELWWFCSWETVLRFAFFAHVSLLILVNVVVWVIYAMLRRGGTKGKWLQPSEAQGEFSKKKGTTLQ